MKKRILSILLCLCLVMMLMPATALSQNIYTLTLRGADHINYFTATIDSSDTLVVTEEMSVDLAAGTEVELACFVYKDALFAGWNVVPTGAVTIPDSPVASFTMPAKNFSIQPIVVPINAQISSDGILTWNAISGCTSKVSIYVDEGFVTSFLMASGEIEASGGSYIFDLEAAFQAYEEDVEKLPSDTYFIWLYYYKDGALKKYVENAIEYDYIGQLIKLAAPTNPRWEGFVAKWDPVENAASYTLSLSSEMGGSQTGYGLITLFEPQFNLFDLRVDSLKIGAKYSFGVVANPAENSDIYLPSGYSGRSAQSAPLPYIIGAIVTPDELIFEEKGEGYTALSPQEFTIRNTGTGQLANLEVSLTGTNSGSFILNKTSTAASLAAKGETSFTVVPITGLAEGTYEATAEVSADQLTTIKKPISFTVLHTHTYEDDGDCTTPVYCSTCGELVIPAKSHHELSDWQHDHTNHWKKCTNAGCVHTEQLSAHTPSPDDGDCTTPVYCSVCGYMTTAAKTHDFTGAYLYDGDNHWHLCANDGCSVIDEKKAHTWIAGTITKSPTYFADGEQVYNCLCGAAKNVVLPQLIDANAPTGSISIGTHKWNSFLNTITFGLFFKETQTVSVTANDAESGVDKTYYYLSERGLSKEEAASLTSWTVFSESFNIAPNHNYVVYVKITDQVGNSSIINSDGLVLDNIVPQISGVTDGAIYCAAVPVTVSDDNLGVVTLNGEEVTLTEGKFTINPKNGEQTIAAADKAGNSIVLKITVNDGHRWDEGRVTTPSTAAAEGVKTYTCVHCGAPRTESIAKLAPSIIEGQGSTYELGASGTLIFRSDAAFADFIKVTMDGNTLSPGHYNLSDGSIVVELKEEYLETLAVGTHLLGIHSAGGTATATLTVKAKDKLLDALPKLGDRSMGGWWLLGSVSAIGIFLILGGVARRKRSGA